MTDVCSIIVNYNSEKEVISLCKDIHSKCKRIIIVDNSPPSTGLEEIVSEKNNITYINSGGNIGYGAGNNLGIKHLHKKWDCDYYFVINPDVEIRTDDLIDQLSRDLEQNPDLGIVAPAIGDSPQSNQHSSSPVINLMQRLNYLPDPELQSDSLISRSQVIGCAMMISQELIEDIGMFDPNFFLYVEEIEYCFRARQAGYEIAYNPDCSIEHGEDTNGLSHPKYYQIYYRTRNTFLLSQRRFQGVARWVYVLSVLLLLYAILINGRFKLLKAWLKGVIDGVRGVDGRIDLPER
jgi:GT2 family glycosyltransferase